MGTRCPWKVGGFCYLRPGLSPSPPSYLLASRLAPRWWSPASPCANHTLSSQTAQPLVAVTPARTLFHLCRSRTLEDAQWFVTSRVGFGDIAGRTSPTIKLSAMHLQAGPVCHQRYFRYLRQRNEKSKFCPLYNKHVSILLGGCGSPPPLPQLGVI